MFDRYLFNFMISEMFVDFEESLAFEVVDVEGTGAEWLDKVAGLELDGAVAFGTVAGEYVGAHVFDNDF